MTTASKGPLYGARTQVLVLALLGLWLGGCSDVVHVRLLRGECEDQSLSDIFSANAKLRRSDGVGVERCVTIRTALNGLGDLEHLLSDGVVFDDIPTGGDWTIWVEGYSSASCSTGGLLCGKNTGLTLPPPSGQIEVVVDCKPLVSVGKFKKIKDCLTK